MSETWKPTLLPSEEPIYSSIIRALSADIDSGRLKANSRLPTHRELAESLGVALGTITRAYAEAERRGMIHSEGRRGTFVGATRRLKPALATLADLESPAIDLSRNHPPAPADPSLSAALKALAKRSDIQQLMQYAPAPGLPRHREAGAAWVAQLGMAVDPESVIVTAGAQHGLMVVLAALTEPGDLIACKPFTYPGVMAIADRLRLQLTGVPSDESGMLPDALEAICRQRKVRIVYCNPTLHNPTNVIVPVERRRAIAAVAEKYDINIVEDEIFRPLLPDPPAFTSSLAPDRSCVVLSASKTIAAGLRVGFVVTAAQWRQKVIDSVQTSMLSASSLAAEVVTNWFADGTADKVIARRRQELAARQQMVLDMLHGYDINSHPYSTHAWLKLPGRWSSMQLSVEAQRHGVSIAPAELFMVDRRAPASAVRISVGATDTRDGLRAGLQILADILDRSGRSDVLTV